MTTLHLIRTSDFTSNHFNSALKVMNENDGLILLDDACYNLNHRLIHNDIIQQCIDKKRFYVVNEHCKARAISIDDKYQRIQLSALIELSFQYNKVLTWQ